MELSPTLIICIFTILRSFQIHDISIYAMNKSAIWVHEHERNLTLIRMNNFDLFFILILSLITDRLRYRSVMISSSIVTIIAFVVYFNVEHAFETEVAYTIEAFIKTSTIASSTYLYSKIPDTSKYQKITAYVHASSVVGILLNKYWSQIYVYTLRNVVRYIPFFSNAAVYCILLVCSFILPPVHFNGSKDDEKAVDKATDEINLTANNTVTKKKRHIGNKMKAEVEQIWYNFKTAYTNTNVLKWSVWYSLTEFLIIQIQNDREIELSLVADENSFMLLTSASMAWNSLCLIISATLVILCSLKPTKWETRGNWVLSLVSFILAVLTVIEYAHVSKPIRTIISSISVLIADLFLTISVWEIVAIVPKNSYALVTGFNIFVAHLLQRIFSQLNEAEYLIIYGMIFVALGIVFGVLQKITRSQSAQNINILGHRDGEIREY